MDEPVFRSNGAYFGWIDGGDLYTRDGRHVGQITKFEVFAPTGGYLGELRGNRLLTDIAKKGSNRGFGFLQARLRVLAPQVSLAPEDAHDLPSGFEDFPPPADL